MGGAILGPAVGAVIVAEDGFRVAIPFWGMVMLCCAVVYSGQLLIWSMCGWTTGELDLPEGYGKVKGDEEEDGERESLIGGSDDSAKP